MKLTVGRGRYSDGFALPTILLVSTVMLIVLTASIAAAAASRVSLDSQYYNQLAQQAAQSGLNRAQECLKSNGYAPQWATAVTSRDLRPDTECTGATIGAAYASPYIVGNGGSNPSNMRTKYSVEAPSGTTIGSILKIVGTTELVRTSTPNNVWRSYEQALYLRIEPPKTVSCPDGFIAVPGDARFSTNDFCVGKYEAKNVGGKAVSQAGGSPWSGLNQVQAKQIAEDACAGCSLMTEAQWLTVANNVVNVNSNWSGSVVGSGYIYQGHSDGNPSTALAAGSDDNGYVNTNNTNGNQRRTLRLNNGEVIWDLAGNAEEVLADIYTGTQPGNGSNLTEWSVLTNTGTLSASSIPKYGTPAAASWTGLANGIGALWANTTTSFKAEYARGGHAQSGYQMTGVFALSTSNPYDNTYNSAIHGFRLVYNPLSSTTCPSGQILIPGNSTFGTKNFCVGKYEAKNVGGIATSQAAGAPWTSISQADAATAASSACGSCRLIGEAEWLTIAHNVVNVPSNWSGSSVGSGYIYSGHNDNYPASVLAASANDNDGYSGTSNTSGNQRRTLKLNTGDTIWDFAGNAAEWMSYRVAHANYPKPIGGWREWNTITDVSGLAVNPLPAYGTPAAQNWTTSNGIGGVLPNTNGVSDPGAVARGGSRTHGAYAGIFEANFNMALSYADVGFRIVSDPITAISCSGGMIPVPGDSRFGTTDFCVGKYEAKNVGGVAVSQAAGTPWTSISPNNAAIAASAACAKCRLIGEAEWMTIAHNILSVPNNWRGGTVGVGGLYRGHTDNVPASALAASTDDNDGYYGTGNTAGSDQRRTFYLSNGQVIWDMSGNLYDFTSAQVGSGKPGAVGMAWREWNAITDNGTIVPNPFPAFGTPAASSWTNTSHGIGMVYSDSSDTSLKTPGRGGYRNSSTWGSGIFSVAYATPVDYGQEDTWATFRVVEVK